MKKWIAALSIGTLALSMAASAEISYVGKDSASISFAGDVQYRFQYDYINISTADGNSKAFSSGDYLNKYAWNLFIKANPSKNLLIGLRLSNPMGYNLDAVANNRSISGNVPSSQLAPSDLLAIPEMYLKWTVGMFALTAGIIPVMGNTVFDLTCFENSDYLLPGGFAAPGYYPWAVGMNNSLKAVDLNFAFLNTPDLGLGLDVMAAIDSNFTPPSYTSDASPSTGLANELKQNQYRLAGSLPISLMNKMMTITPEVNWHTNVVHSADFSKEDHIFTGGGDISVKPIKDFTAKAGFAAGGYRNDALQGSATYTEHAPLGLLTNLGASYTYLPATTAMIDFAYGSTIDRQQTGKFWENLYYWDVKNPFPVMKLILIPRVRVWYYTDSKDDRTKVQVRPEVNVKAGF